jgi:hypothetical protein
MRQTLKGNKRVPEKGESLEKEEEDWMLLLGIEKKPLFCLMGLTEKQLCVWEGRRDKSLWEEGYVKGLWVAKDEKRKLNDNITFSNEKMALMSDDW